MPHMESKADMETWSSSQKESLTHFVAHQLHHNISAQSSQNIQIYAINTKSDKENIHQSLHTEGPYY